MDGSVHVDGLVLTSSGKELKLGEMFLKPPTIKPVWKDERKYLFLRHPGAKICYERPSGTSWFTCRMGEDAAMKRATSLQTQWGN